jgi:hypothetical protein
VSEIAAREELGAARYRQFADLCSEVSLNLNADDAVLDGEIVKLDDSGEQSTSSAPAPTA